MNIFIIKVFVLKSFSINIGLVGIAFFKHQGMHDEFSSYGGTELVFSIGYFLLLAGIACWPWLLALSQLSEKMTISRIVFSILSTLSAVYFFIPSPLHPSEALTYALVAHLFSVWCSYPLSLFSRVFQNDNN